MWVAVLGEVFGELGCCAGGAGLLCVQLDLEPQAAHLQYT